MNKDRLQILANWLMDKSYYYNERDGAMESAIRCAKQDVCVTIGDYIDEIIEMDDEQIDNIIKEIEREELK